MNLDENILVATVEAVIRKTSKGEDVYSHNLRLEFGTYDDMGVAETCLKKQYSNRFKIRTEIQPPSSVKSGDKEFDKKTKYFILMTSRNWSPD